MEALIGLYFIGFLVLIFLGLPIAFSMGVFSIVTFATMGGNLRIIPQKMFAGIDVFTFLAIPFFILAGQIMNVGGINKKIVEFCDNLVGHIIGGLAHVNVLASLLFAGLSGSASADAAGLGSVEIEIMKKAKYPENFSAAITAASAIIGPIIPPRMSMIIYAVVAGNASVISLFLGGVIPGALVGVSLLVISYYMAKKHNFPVKEERAPLEKLVKSLLKTGPALLMPLIIIGGILSGVTTVTESAAVAVFYAIIISIYVYRSIGFKDLLPAFLEAAKMTSTVMFIIAVAASMGWIFTSLQIPQAIADIFLNYANSALLFILITNVLLLLIGTVLDLAPALLIAVPILAPTAAMFNIDPVHFGVMVVVNLCIGLITPPVGMVLFVTANVAKVKLSDMYKSIMPFLLVEIVVLLLIAYVPMITTFLPRLFGM